MIHGESSEVIFPAKRLLSKEKKGRRMQSLKVTMRDGISHKRRRVYGQRCVIFFWKNILLEQWEVLIQNHHHNLHVTIFGNYETLMKSVNKIGPLVEKSESGPAKMCWIQLKTETEKQLRDKRALEEEREQILKEEEEENGKEAAEKLRVVLTELELNALMSLIDKCSLRIQCHILKVGASHQCFLKLQDDFGFIQTVVTNEMIKNIKAKVESLDWEELAELEKILDPPPGTSVTVTDANGAFISEQIHLNGIQEAINVKIGKPDS